MDSELRREENELFPVFLKLQNFNTLLVGGGNVGLEKLEAMLNNSPLAQITLVAERVLPGIILLAEHFENLTIKKRAFGEGDLEGKSLVVLATDDFTLHQRIVEICKQRKILVNVADTPLLCDFYLGSIVKKGNLKVAISTNGKSPTIAKRLKVVLQENLPEQLDQVLEHIHQLREKLKGDFTAKVKQLDKITSGLVSEKKVFVLTQPLLVGLSAGWALAFILLLMYMSK